MSKPAITMADLGLTPGEQQLFAQGARHLYGDETQPPQPDEPAPAVTTPKPAPKPKAQKPAKPQGALASLTLKGSPGARKAHVPGKAKGSA